MGWTAYHDAVADQNAALYQMIVRLRSHGWVGVDSGDGRAVSGTPGSGTYGNGTDIITGCSNSGVWVAGNLSNFRAWLRMRSPLGLNGPEFIVHHQNFGPGSHSYGIWFVPAPTAGPYPSAASDTPGVLPNLASSILSPNIVTSPADATSGNVIFTHSGAQTLHMMVGDAAEGYAFYAFTSTAANKLLSGLMLDCLEDTDPSDESPYVIHCNGPLSTPWQGLFNAGTSQWGKGGSANPAAPFGALLSKTSDPDSRGLASYAMPAPAHSSHWILDAVNPYATEYEAIMGCYWAHCATWESFTPFGGGHGLIKGRSRIVKGFAPLSGPADGNTNVGRTLNRQSAYWILWDGVTLENADVTVVEKPYGTVMQRSARSWVYPVTEIYNEASVIQDSTFGKRILQAAFDSGTGGWVYWMSYGSPNPTPTSQITQPNYTGALSSYHIVFAE